MNFASPHLPVVAATRRRGFTLVEVLISIAIALVLILGISQIFSLAQRTTGAGTQVLAATESNRGIQEMLLNDARGITNAVGDSPGIAILSFPQAVFRSSVDLQHDNDQQPQTLNDPINAGASLGPEPVSTIDDRVHRTDLFGFFARGSFTRRTGDGMIGAPYSLTSPKTSGEAFIWYGHLALPDNNAIKGWQYAQPSRPTSGQYWNPGAGTFAKNSNNFFASDWILGRQVILLSPASANVGTPYIYGISSNLNPLWLLANNSASRANDSGIPIYSSRYDLADGTIAGYRNQLGSGNVRWWQGILGWDPAGPQLTRFEANPFVTKPATSGQGNETQKLSAAIAQMSPVFVRGCTQFVVEFAGDYVTQNASGTIGTKDANGKATAGGPDGEIDYVVDPTTGNRQVRWYGFPRDPTGAGNLTLSSGSVLPVRTVMSLAGVTPPPSSLAFERLFPANQNWQSNASATNGLPAVYCAPYSVAWGPDTDALHIPRPKMIRITLAIDDPSGHLNTEQVYQYVMNLP